MEHTRRAPEPVRPAVHRLTTQTRSRDTMDLGQPPVIRLEPNVEMRHYGPLRVTHRGAGCSTTTTAPWIRRFDTTTYRATAETYPLSSSGRSVSLIIIVTWSYLLHDLLALKCI